MNDRRKGAYLLVIELAEEKKIEVGKLGLFQFPSGFYIYTGSAMGGIDKRVKRHLGNDKKLGKDKKLRWHIDYLLNCAKITHIATVESTTKIECRLNQALASLIKGVDPVAGFGSSDCTSGCKSHLLYLPDWESSNVDEKLEGVMAASGYDLSICRLDIRSGE